MEAREADSAARERRGGVGIARFPFGNEFRGVFSANNSPDFANFPQGVTYQRAANFNTKTLNDGSGNPVAVSIDPFYFSVPVIP